MLKTVVLCTLLWHEMSEFSIRAEQCLTNTPVLNFPAFTSPKINDTNVQIEPKLNHNGTAAPQIFYVNGSLFGLADLGFNLSRINNVPRADYLVTNGIGAHKVHRHRVKWNKARRICIDEGGHLTVIKSESEEKIILQMMADVPVHDAWVGFHDQFEEGHWTSIFDEPLGENGWSHWTKIFNPNPGNYGGNQNCARLMKDGGGGIDDWKCSLPVAFVCKINLY